MIKLKIDKAEEYFCFNQNDNTYMCNGSVVFRKDSVALPLHLKLLEHAKRWNSGIKNIEAYEAYPASQLEQLMTYHPENEVKITKLPITLMSGKTEVCIYTTGKHDETPVFIYIAKGYAPLIDYYLDNDTVKWTYANGRLAAYGHNNVLLSLVFHLQMSLNNVPNIDLVGVWSKQIR